MIASIQTSAKKARKPRKTVRAKARKGAKPSPLHRLNLTTKKQNELKQVCSKVIKQGYITFDEQNKIRMLAGGSPLSRQEWDENKKILDEGWEVGELKGDSARFNKFLRLASEDKDTQYLIDELKHIGLNKEGIAAVWNADSIYGTNTAQKELELMAIFNNNKYRS